MQQEVGKAGRFLGDCSSAVIGACIEVHRHLGPGLLESAYRLCLAHELSERGLQFEREQPLRVTYKGVQLECGYRLDFVVQGSLIVELKAVESLAPVHEAQLLTYLKLTGVGVGLLVNFNTNALRLGLRRLTLKQQNPS